MRLIDVDAIPKSAIAFSTDGRFYVAWSEIVKAPTIEAEPVVHGRWIKVYDDSAGWVDMCNKCKEFGEGTHYCPNCGAKMDGRSDGE